VASNAIIAADMLPADISERQRRAERDAGAGIVAAMMAGIAIFLEHCPSRPQTSWSGAILPHNSIRARSESAAENKFFGLRPDNRFSGKR